MQSLFEETDKRLTIAFTGHRPQHLGGFKPNRIHDACKNFLELAIKQAVEDGGYQNFISGGALGIDQWAAEKVISYYTCNPRSDVRLIVARPFPSQDAAWPEWSKKKFQELLSLADLVVDVCQDPYAPWKMIQRDKWMVDNCSLLIAVGGVEDSGTMHTVEYAEKQGVPVFRFDPFTGEVSGVPGWFNAFGGVE